MPFLLFLVVLCSASLASAVERFSIQAGDFPVRSVIVFSDQARITRAGELPLERGLQILDLPRLPQSIVPDSVRVEAAGARVTHVEVHPVEPGVLPKTEAEELVDHLQGLRDEANKLQDQLNTANEELQFIESIRPNADPITQDRTPPVLLNPAGWTTALAFFDSNESELSLAIGHRTATLQEKREEIARVEEKARQLLGAAGDGRGYTVTVTVDGKGAGAKLTLTYMARGARWYPSYDVRYSPGRASVELGFSGLVQQETGEDWTDAHLTLSTAVPTVVTTLPELAVWKIGDRERFIPTPQPGPPEGTPPPRPGPVPRPVSRAAGEDIRQRLLSALGGMPAAADAADAAPVPVRDRTRLTAAHPRKGAVASDFGIVNGISASAVNMPPAAAPAPPPALEEEAKETSEDRAQAFSRVTTGSTASLRGPSEYVSFSAPGGWQAPVYAADLPAALAGGYDFSYESARPESIRTGAEARRVPLFAGQYPADAWIRILPALSHSAYLVAEVTNTGQVPWLKGQAHLFVGADLVGDAAVPTTAPAEKVTLPLGIDDAIRVERNVQTVASERGMFSRQDVSAYEVTVELLNTRATAVPLRVRDQIPLARQPEVVITTVKTEPPPFKSDKELKEDGAMEWRMDLAPGQKQVIKFQYEVARPKGWKLWQTSAPGVSR
jgi:hypothetical protein